MITFNSEQMEKLKPLENEFRRAYFHAYKHSTTNPQNIMVNDLYNEATGRKDRRNMSCGYCVLKLFQDCAKIYFDTLEENERVEKELEPESESGNTITYIKRKNNSKKNLVANNE